MPVKNPVFEAMVCRDRVGRFKKGLWELGYPVTDSASENMPDNEKLRTLSSEAVNLASEGDYDTAQDFLDHFGDEDSFGYQVGLNAYFDSCLRHFHMDTLPREAVSRLFQSCERQSPSPVMRTRDFYQTVQEYAGFYQALDGNN